MIIQSNLIDRAHLENIASHMGITIERFAYVKQGMNFVLRPAHDGRDRYRRTNHPNLGGKPRRLWAICWHGFRDFMLLVYRLDPNAVIKTAMITYKGLDDFMQNYQDTGNGTVGSWSSTTYKETCNCPPSIEQGDKGFAFVYNYSTVMPLADRAAS